MARPRKSSNVLNATGAFKKNPSRKRNDAEGVGIIGAAPSMLSETEQELWEKIKTMVPPGVVTGSDELLLEVLARYWSKLRATPTDEITASQVSTIIAGCNALCMTPQSRTKVSAPVKERKNEFEGF
ncbi:MAG: hypothetical protein ACI8PB_000336 [Desulforhopalus sp.]|jgi:hypothetical protein